MQSAAAILANVSRVPWFAAADRRVHNRASQEALDGYVQSCHNEWPGRWASGWQEADQVVHDLDDASAFWLVEERWRRQAFEAARRAGREEMLADALHRLSIIGYDAVRPTALNEELARVASGAALWTVAEAVTWAVAEDLLQLSNPFAPKLHLFELGHWPLGVWQGSIVVM